MNTLTKNGGGNVVIFSQDTYAGETVVTQGDLIVHNPDALGAPSATNVQQITLTNAHPGLTTFSLTFNGATTNPLIYAGTPADATSIQTALNALATIGGVGASVTVTETTTGNFVVAFGGSLANTIVPGIIVTVVNQELVIDAAVAGETKFNLTFKVATTGSISYSGTAADATAIQTALNALSTIGGVGGSVTVAELGPGYYQIIFGGSLAAATQPGISFVALSQELVLTTPVAGETEFNLTFKGVTTSAITDSGSDAAAIQTALNGLSTIGGVGGSYVTQASAGTYWIVFGGSLASSIQQPLISLAVISQELVLGSAVVGQTEFNLTFKGATTGTITYTGTTADATAIQTVLNGLSTIGGVVSSVGVSQTSPGTSTGIVLPATWRARSSSRSSVVRSCPRILCSHLRSPGTANST